MADSMEMTQSQDLSMWREEPHMPRAFGPYQVLEIIGSGGMGTVYRAKDSRLHREVALKVLSRNPSVSRARDRFLREARVVSSLSHPNICTLFDIGEQDGDPFLVMELLHGESLKERLQRGPLTAGEIWQLALGVGSALVAAHQRGIIHRDIKPANLFLVRTSSGMDVRILDFGLAKFTTDTLRSDPNEGITRYGATLGTVEYMSPEQARGEQLDARSDLFALGAVLYESATGQVPFRGCTSAVVFSELLNEEPTPPREANLTVPPELDQIIRKLLVKDRAKRVQSASDLLALLAGCGPAGSAPQFRNKPPVARKAEPPPSAVGNSRSAPSTQVQQTARPRQSDGDLSDPVARSAERRHQILAGSNRPVARYDLVDAVEAFPFGNDAGSGSAALSAINARMLAVLLLASLMAISAYLFAHARA